MKYFLRLLPLLIILLFTSCETNQAIAHNVDEREANEIVVFLASKGIIAQKVESAAAAGAGAGNAPTNMYDINVDPHKSTEAMALLNRFGLPRQSGTNLLTLFAKSGLMSSDREETIRYQAGLAEELKNTIRKIDGIIDAEVQLSFPPTELTPNLTPGATPPKVTAAVYIKHQGVMEDPNSHLEVKIKRLLAGSVNGLDFENVSVISDRRPFGRHPVERRRRSDRRKTTPTKLREHLGRHHDQELTGPLPHHLFPLHHPPIPLCRGNRLPGLQVLSDDANEKNGDAT